MAEGLSKRLRDQREQLGLTQTDVAERTGIRRSALSEIETGSRKVSSDELAELAHIYGTSADYLLTGEIRPEEPIRALARVMGDMTDDDVAEVVRFAEFLRSRSQS